MPKGWNGAMDQFRLIGVLEGISYVVLLFIAMPLKYFADMPNAVKYVGFWLIPHQGLGTIQVVIWESHVGIHRIAGSLWNFLVR
jgi:hypothetical protein